MFVLPQVEQRGDQETQAGEDYYPHDRIVKYVCQNSVSREEIELESSASLKKIPFSDPFDYVAKPQPNQQVKQLPRIDTSNSNHSFPLFGKSYDRKVVYIVEPVPPTLFPQAKKVIPINTELIPVTT